MANIDGYFGKAVFLVCLFWLAATAQAAELSQHTFDCKNCHISSLSVSQLGEGNVCLSCHDRTLNMTLSDGATGTTITALNPLDASNAFNNNAKMLPGKGQTSHNWSAPDTRPGAGATAPDRSLYPQFYSRFGSSQDKVTCSRCHNPHADRSNPQLLVLGPGSAQQMCLACHSSWHLGSGRTNVTHPVDINYVAATSAHPGKYTAAPSEDDGNLHTAGQISLFGGRILCGTCHQTHFADSDAATADTPANYASLTMNGGDGKLLRGHGAGRTDPSGLCRSCHSYQAHGDGTGERPGCQVCHSGHSYDPVAPNYYLLRKRATTTQYGTVSGLDYSSPDVLDAAAKFTFWNDQVDGTANGYCEKCHGDAKTIGAGAGKYHVAAAVCTDCHGHGQPGGAFAANCNACHGMPPVAATAGGPDGLAASPGPTGSTTPGAHAVHSTAKQYPCDTCHANSVGTGPTHNDGTPQSVTIGFSMFNDAYRGGAYNGQAGVAYDASQADTTVTSSGAKICANVYCHGGTMASNGGTNRTPAWDNPATGSCGKCHGATATTPPQLGSHRTHVLNGTWTYDAGRFNPPNPYIYGQNLACDTCHDNAATAHVDGKAEWAFDTTAKPWLGGAQYRGSATGNVAPVAGTYGKCTNLYCHSIAQTATGGPLTGLPGEYKTPTWGALNEGTCGSCHDADQGHAWFANRGSYGNWAPYIASGSHAKHLQSLAGSDPVGMGECAVCHNYAGSDGLSGCATLCHNRNDLHVNHAIDVKFPPTVYGASAAYSGTPAPGDGFGNCSSTYCHSNGTSVVTATIPANTSAHWGSATLTCDACHGNPPAYVNASPKANSHTAHGSITCDKCHNTTTTTGTTITGATSHVNKVYEVVAGSGAAFTYTYAASGGSCAAISCHSGGSAQWGTTLACGDCHALPPATGAHLAHTDGAGAAYTSDSNASTPTAYGFNCGNCHAMDGAKHGNGAVDIELYNASATGFKMNNPANAGRTGTGAATICSNIYCHSTGQDGSVRAYVETPRWDGSFSGNRCAGCHGDPPAYSSGGAGQVNANSHYSYSWEWVNGLSVKIDGGHLVGLHFDNIKKNPPDELEPLFPSAGTLGSGAGHGDPTTSTTISCPTCHAGTVSIAGQFSAPDTAFNCSTSDCHPIPIAGSIANRANHVNGFRDVQFMTGEFRTRAQMKPDFLAWPGPETKPGPFTALIEPLGWTRNNGYKAANNSHDSIPFSGSYNATDKSCTTACHLNQPVKWGELNFDCFSCHADL